MERLTGGENIWGKSIPGRGSRKCKGPEAGAALGLRNSRETSEARKGSVREGYVAGNEVLEATGSQTEASGPLKRSGLF